MTQISKRLINYIVFLLLSFGVTVYLFNILKRKIFLHEFYHSGLTDKSGIFIWIVTNVISIFGIFKKYTLLVRTFWGMVTTALLLILQTFFYGFDFTILIFIVLSFIIALSLQLIIFNNKLI